MRRATRPAKMVLAMVIAAAFGGPVHAGIPVIDATNVVQTTISAMQNVAAVAKQIQQYETQLQQYQNMLQNTLAPAAYVWDQANQTISKLLQAQDMLNYYKNQAGSIDSYLSRYQDVAYYRSSPCFTATGCTDAQRQALLDAQVNGSAAQKRANDAVLQGVDQQQQTLVTDAANLRKLQSQVTSAQGQMQALQAANQLASAQTNQLLQIRGMLAAQATAAATRAQVIADREAQQAASAKQLRDGSNITNSTPKNWTFE
ncbi:conjugal transfer protein TrbJ [Burkholderia pseudomallei]|uniref:P-type conjugative transfer protein TrbJ n=2 Tax=Burkholderia pseudomallei TaxID=28450 RepID=UPI000F17B220|nr:conjugal transfer protein TrbJ [Burkholderia pseudomallei]CAJ3784871.1 conjugal transfer protein TrbJ [Burkholderia pseudomallei]CAJ6269555.1 conjugal transfer protein TrbJ [Burkholderia pseudomallei]CAJ6404884.1 conjugal transfer protein TrbJ [Burkholderia pseudomallei]CAJ7718185.1 conjugal transfer protein TrbJ [Burkholderia pseudomallei]